MTKPWERHREHIISLYKAQNLPLHQVRQQMIKDHNFVASIRAYRTRFDKWRVSKYNVRRPSVSTTYSSTPSTLATGASPILAPAAPAGTTQYPQAVFPLAFSEPAVGVNLDGGLYIDLYRKQTSFDFATHQNRMPNPMRHPQTSPVAGPADQMYHSFCGGSFMFPHDGNYHPPSQSPGSQDFLELEDVEYKAENLKQEDES